jgi:hypothetical protein
MAKIKLDGIVEAVHYTPDGQIDWVRAYERRGPIFSDHVLIRRPALLDQLKAGKRFATGSRKEYLGAVFETGAALRLAQHAGGEAIVTGEPHGQGDHLQGVPII